MPYRAESFPSSDEYVSHEAEVSSILEMEYKPSELENLDADKLQHLADEIEHLEEYDDYRNQKITYETLAEIARTFEENAKGDIEEIEQTRKALAYFSEEIARNANRYYNFVLEMERWKIMYEDRLDPREYREIWAKKDEQRRRIHNSLISDLHGFTRLCNTRLPELGVHVPDNQQFSDAELESRESLGTWAYNLEKERRLIQIHDRALQLIKEKKS